MRPGPVRRRNIPDGVTVDLAVGPSEQPRFLEHPERHWSTVKDIGSARRNERPVDDLELPMVGREAETADFVRRLAAGRSHGEVLILTGDPGAGKSVLLDFAADRARREGGRVLRAVGTESEAKLGFAGLHQLLRPVLGELDGLPSRQRSALRTVLGLDESAEASDGMLVGLAVLTLVSDLAEPAPLLVVADDAQWLDRASLDVLSFVARRMDSEPVTLLVGVRAAAPLPGFDNGYERLEVGPLDGAAANRLLDRQPLPPPCSAPPS